MARPSFHCSVVTPEKAALECDAHFVAFPAHDGEMGILAGRAPLLCRVGIGLLRAETEEGWHRLFIAGGFGQMVENRLTILTEEAKELSELDREQADKLLEEARALKISDERSFAARQHALESARVQRKLTAVEEY